MRFYAHTVEGKGEEEWHLLAEHLRNTGVIASSFACNEKYTNIFKMAGYLHDLGKYQPAFQKYLKEGGRRGSVPHSAWGAGYALILKYQEIAFAIDGHHKGLPDKSEAQNDLAPYKKREQQGFDDIINIYHNDLSIDKEHLQAEMPELKDIFERELFTRYLFSSLTDADWLDTEKACNPELSSKRERKELDIELLTSRIEEEINKKPKEGELNILRNKTRDIAAAKAEMSPGFYSMNLPTGMGKTLTSVSWALKHAEYNTLKRIIIVLPFINIIDQTAEILKDIFGEEYVLEHHSGISEDFAITEGSDSKEYTRRLACENWDYPIIITTTVQFFESLFSNRTSKCRKIHNIAESVVIFDEVQSLPKNLILPTLTMLKNVQSVMKTSFLFCTATLPAFEKREGFDGIETITPLVEDPEVIFSKTRRVTYLSVNNFYQVDFDELTELAEKQNRSVLAVFNTKKSAREFYDLVKQSDLWERYYHLSTSMYPLHRKQVIKDIRDDLENRRKIIVSSTQLIEAGVDFDFPCVLRETAPLESIIQAAGRCNRENRMEEYGKVFLFFLKDSRMPDKQYRSAAEFALEQYSGEIEKLYRHGFYNEYYKRFIQLFVDADKNKINEARNNFNFKTVSQGYRIIEKITKGLIIYNDQSSELIDSIKSKKFLSRDDYRILQLYTVQVYDSFIINNKNSIGETEHGLLIWYGGYDAGTGIDVAPVSSDEYVV